LYQITFVRARSARLIRLLFPFRGAQRAENIMAGFCGLFNAYLPGRPPEDKKSAAQWCG